MEIRFSYSRKHFVRLLIKRWLSLCHITICLLCAYLLFNLIYFLLEKEFWFLGFIDYLIYFYLICRIISRFVIAYRQTRKACAASFACFFDKDQLSVESAFENTKIAQTKSYEDIRYIEKSRDIILKGKNFNLLIPFAAVTDEQKSEIIKLINNHAPTQHA